LNPSKRSQSSPDNSCLSEADFNARWEPLAKGWITQGQNDLDIRRQTGTLLNDYLGVPGTRLRRGDETIKKVAKELGVSVGEISRLRQYAYQFESNKMVADATTWDAVKKALPKRASSSEVSEHQPKNGDSSTSGSSRIKDRRIRAAKRALKGLASSIREVERDLTVADREDLCGEARKFMDDILSPSQLDDPLKTSDTMALVLDGHANARRPDQAKKMSKNPWSLLQLVPWLLK
jgi:hypothetical protein